MSSEEYVAIPLGNPFTHEQTGFCIDPSCPCHDDQDLIGEVNEMYQDGLLTGNEATERVKGWML